MYQRTNIDGYPQLLLLGPDGHTSLDVEPGLIPQFGAPPLLNPVSIPPTSLDTPHLSGVVPPHNPSISLPTPDNGVNSPISLLPSIISSAVVLSSTSALPKPPFASPPSSKIIFPFVATFHQTPTQSTVPPTTVPLVVIASAAPPLPLSPSSHSRSASSNVVRPFTTFHTSSTGTTSTTKPAANTATTSPLPSTTKTVSPVITSSPSPLSGSGNTSHTVRIVLGSIFGALAGLILILILSLYILRVRHKRKHRNDNVYGDVEGRWPPHNAHVERVHGIGRMSDEEMSTASALSQSTSLDLMPVTQSLHVANHAPGDFSSDERSGLSPHSQLPYSSFNEFPPDIYGTPRISRAPFLAVADDGLAYEETSTLHPPFPGSQGIVRDPYLSRAASVATQHPSTLSADGWRADVLRNKLFTNVLLMKDRLSGSRESQSSDNSDDVAHDHFTRVPTRSSVGSAGRKRRPSSTGRGLSRLPSAASEYSQASTSVPVSYSPNYSMGGALLNPHPPVFANSGHPQMPDAAYPGRPFEPINDSWPSMIVEAGVPQKWVDSYSSWTRDATQDDLRRPISLPPSASVTAGRFLHGGGGRKRRSSIASSAE